MKKSLSLGPVIALLLSLALAGCATAPGSDPTLVHAQQTIKQAKLTMDAFVHLERGYEMQLKAISPDFHTYAETVRAHGQQWLHDGWDAVEAYRVNKDSSKLDAALAVLQSAVKNSQHYL